MDMGSLIGIPLGFMAIIISIFIGGFSILLYLDLPSVFITLVGSFAALMVSSDMGVLSKITKYFALIYKQPKSNVADIIKTLVSFSEKSRREGLLSLEDDVESLTDEFFKQGIRLVVDGTDPDVIKAILYNQMNQKASRHAGPIKLFSDWCKLAPAWGMIGTLYGLVGMLANMGDPSAIGKGMAAALITTFYGAIFANLVFGPAKDKLEMRSNGEVGEMEIIVEGILSIQTGDNPRVVEEKLLAFIPPKDRAKLKTSED